MNAATSGNNNHNTHFFNTHTSLHTAQTAYLDSGCSDSILRKSDAELITTIDTGSPHIDVMFPNGAHASAAGKGTIQHNTNLSIPVHVFPDGTINKSLLAVADYCNAGCTVTFTATGATVTRGEHTVLQSHKSPTERLWEVPIHQLTPPTTDTPYITSANHVVTLQYDAERVAFWHAAMGCPPVSTFQRAVSRGFLGTLPQLTGAMVRANPPLNVATPKGHLHLNRQQAKRHPPPTSTSNGAMNTEDTTDTDPPEPDTPDMIIRVIALEPVGTTAHTDSTAKFTVTGHTGIKYVWVVWYNGYVHLVGLHDRNKATYIRANEESIRFFRSRGHTITAHRMDNETSHALNEALLAQGVQPEYVPPHNHRANRAERAIQSTKNHIVSTLAAAPQDMQLNLWSEALELAEITLNTLTPYPSNTSISCYEGIHRQPFDFNKHPIAPFGTRVVIFENPQDRASWGAHGVLGNYLGPAMYHYRCHRVYAAATKGIQIADTVAWFPEPYIMPGSSPMECLNAAITDLSTAMTRAVDSTHVQLHNRQAFDHANDTVTAQLRAAVEMFTPPVAPLAAQPVAPAATQPPEPVVLPQDSDLQHDATAELNVPAGEPSLRQRVPAPSAEAVSVPAPAEAAPAQEHRQRTWLPKTTPARATRQRVQRTTPTDEAEWERAIGPTTRSNTKATPRTSGRQRQETKRYQAIAQHVQQTHYCGHTAARNPGTDPRTMRQAKQQNAAETPMWTNAEHEEFVRLVTTTKTGAWIQPGEKPRDRKASYYNPQPKIKIKDGQKVYRVRGTYGGDRGDFCGESTALTASLNTLKMLLNATISEDESWMTADIKDFYLGTPLDRCEYMRVHRNQVPQRTIDHYQLQDMFTDDHILMRLDKGIYGLKQAGKLAQDRLFKHLAAHDYIALPNTPCTFRHRTRGTVFTVVVDDFGIKYHGKEDAQHLIDTLQLQYEITIDWTGGTYLGFDIAFDRDGRTVTLSMPGYVQKAMTRFAVERKTTKTDAPADYRQPVYGKHQQLTEAADDSPPLDAARTLILQQQVGVFTYYAAALDCSMKVAISKIASRQAKPTERLWEETQTFFMQYAASWPDASLRYKASDMQLKVHSDASYLSEANARSRAGGYFYLGNCDNQDTTDRNAPLYALSTIISAVTASACEAEYAALFYNAKEAEGMRNSLADLGYPQKATQLVTDNQAAHGVANRSIKQRKSKAIDMRYHWVRDRVDQQHFCVIWRKGKINLADYFTKIHPKKHHIEVRQQYLG